jgi:hypothetical protein
MPLMLAGSQAAHVLAYRWAYPGLHLRVTALLASGHGYMAYEPLVLGFALAALLVCLLVVARDAALGREARPLPPWAFALLPPLGFTLQEHVERWLHSGVFPWFTVLDPTFRLGLLLQLPFALAAYLAARVLLRVAEHVGRTLRAASAPPRRRSEARSFASPARVELPRLSLLGCSLGERAPPAVALG